MNAEIWDELSAVMDWREVRRVVAGLAVTVAARPRQRNARETRERREREAGMFVVRCKNGIGLLVVDSIAFDMGVNADADAGGAANCRRRASELD